MHSTASTVNPSSADVAPSAAPAKRGRKPGPLSRSAREAQRRLNHSIIEKARRTKINDALATLRQLVPVDYGSTQPRHELRDEEDDDDDDDDELPEEIAKKSKSKPKSKGTGKREEKEKEFKLEILVRTVSFLQDLLKRVDAMENSSPVCQHCTSEVSKKRKYYDTDDDIMPTPKKPAVVRIVDEQHSHALIKSPSINSVPTTPQTFGNKSGARLPSISSWLPNAAIEPTLLSPKAYLPSPPDSSRFDPIRTSQIPPVLNLGPVATAAMVTLPHTSEDESAASLLLQIAASPPFRPTASSTSPNYNLPDPSKFMLHSDQKSQRVGHIRQPQTPASLLGLH